LIDWKLLCKYTQIIERAMSIAKIKAKRTKFNLKPRKMRKLLGYKSKLSLYNKILLYKTILKSIWTYGIQLQT